MLIVWSPTFLPFYLMWIDWLSCIPVIWIWQTFSFTLCFIYLMNLKKVYTELYCWLLVLYTDQICSFAFISNLCHYLFQEDISLPLTHFVLDFFQQLMSRIFIVFSLFYSIRRSGNHCNHLIPLYQLFVKYQTKCSRFL